MGASANTPDANAPHELQVFPDTEALIVAAAEAITLAIEAAVHSHGRCTVALSGGATPRPVYERLGTGARLPWAHIQWCFGDERAVPPDHADSNARLVRETLLRDGPARPEQVHRILAELPAAEAAARYEATLHQLFPGQTRPRFDLMLLGLGPDGHTASLFPDSPALDERERWVSDNPVAKLHDTRITLTYPVLNSSGLVLFLISGASKADALRATLAPTGDARITPARAVQPTVGRLVFFADRAAASALPLSSP